MEESKSYDIFDAAKESGTLIEESAEQQEESTEATTDAVESTEEANNSVEGEISEAEAETEEETNSEEVNEEDSTDSDIVDLNGNNEVEETSNVEDESSQTGLNHFSEMLGGQFRDEADLNQHLIEQQSRIEELEKKSPEFANDYVAKMNEHVANGGSAADFARVQGVNVDEMNPVEILTTELIWNNPGLTKNEAVAYLEDKFPNSLDDEGNLDPNHPTLKVDANKSASVIKGLQAEDTLVAQTGISEEEWNSKTESQKEEARIQAQEADETRMEEWMQPVEDEIENLKSNGLILPLTNDKGFKYPVKMDEAYENELIAKVDKTLMNMGTSFKDNPKAARELIEMHYKMDNFDKLMRASSEKGANSVNKEWFKKVHNPSVVNRGDEAPASVNTPLSTEEQMNRIFGQ